MTRLENETPDELMRIRLREISAGLFFIVGPHRGGTTLLQAMLSTHSAMTIPPETGYFDQVWPRRQQWGPLTDDNLDRVITRIASRDFSVGDLDVEWSQVKSLLRLTDGQYGDLFTVLLTLFADSRHKRRVGEKSPRHLFYADEILGVYPHARFLCLIRDPRAVVRSERETSWGSQSVGRITRRWCRVMQRAIELQRRLRPDQFQTVRYEDLVREPQACLERICRFLGEEFEPTMLNFQERPASEQGFRADEVWKQKTLSSMDSSRIDHWRTDLTPAQVLMIERQARPWMNHLTYVMENPRVSHWDWVTTWIQDRSRWFLEIVSGLIRGRSRRRPWRSVLGEYFGFKSRAAFVDHFGEQCEHGELSRRDEQN